MSSLPAQPSSAQCWSHHQVDLDRNWSAYADDPVLQGLPTVAELARVNGMPPGRLIESETIPDRGSQRFNVWLLDVAELSAQRAPRRAKGFGAIVDGFCINSLLRRVDRKPSRVQGGQH
jgi:hypothetical protein